MCVLAVLTDKQKQSNWVKPPWFHGRVRMRDIASKWQIQLCLKNKISYFEEWAVTSGPSTKRGMTWGDPAGGRNSRWRHALDWIAPKSDSLKIRTKLPVDRFSTWQCFFYAFVFFVFVFLVRPYCHDLINSTVRYNMCSLLEQRP